VERRGTSTGQIGKISEEWAADDIATIMAQLGVFSPPWAA